MKGQAACHSLTIYVCIKIAVFLLFHSSGLPPKPENNQVCFNALKCKNLSGCC